MPAEFGKEASIRETRFSTYGNFLVTRREARPLVAPKEPQLENPDNVVLVSRPTWKQTIDDLTSKDFGEATVLTPELITVTNMPLDNITKGQVEEPLRKVSQVSKERPDATYIVGSPYFADDGNKPFNAAVVFKGGEIAEVAKKRLLEGEERDAFTSIPETATSEVDGSTLVVCRDLIGAQQTRLLGGRNGMEKYIQRHTDDDELAMRYRDAEFIAPETDRLLVPACWGVGFRAEYFKDIPDNDWINTYYQMNLTGTAGTILKQDPAIEQIIVCDRNMPEAPYSATQPMNTVFFKDKA